MSDTMQPIPIAQAIAQAATCHCGRTGTCPTCCCVSPAHLRVPPLPCGSCKHVGTSVKRRGER